MITCVVMPKFTKNIAQGVILNWKFDEGQAVVPGDVLAEIETDTAVMALEAVGSGFLRHILINEGTSVKTGTVVAIIGDLDDDIGPTLKESIKLQKMARIDPRTPRVPASSRNKPQLPNKEPVAARKPRTATTRTSPAPAHERETLAVQADDEAISANTQTRNQAIDQKKQTAFPEEVAPPGIKDVLTVVEDVLEETERHMSLLNDKRADTPPLESDYAPHFHLTTEISMADAERLREQMIDIQRIALSFTTLYVRAAALVFSRHPEFQAACLGYEKGLVDIGIAITVGDRVLVPIIRNCGQKNIAELSEEIQEATQQTRANQCLSEKDSDAFFSIVNFGMYPIEHFIPILSSAQTASLAMGAIRSVQISEDGDLTVDRRMTVSLSCDDENIHEDQAAQFLRTFKQILERPLEIFLPNPVE